MRHAAACFNTSFSSTQGAKSGCEGKAPVTGSALLSFPDGAFMDVYSKQKRANIVGGYFFGS